MADDQDFREARKHYKQAETALRKTELGKNRSRFENALRIAISQSVQAGEFDWDEELANNIPKIRSTWEPANAGAVKLAFHLEQLDNFTALKRLGAAERAAGAKFKIAGSGMSLQGALAAFLRKFARQLPDDRAIGSYRLGPITFDKLSRKQPDKSTVLVLLLAFLFERRLKQKDDEPLEAPLGDKILSGAAWDPAAQFATDTFGGPVEASSAKKFLSEHRGSIRYTGWPKKRRRSAS